ncbi:MAG: hypothetical protein JO132_13120 [Streptosporangiaceae bacterium]|nr:hypothetical protein [Streptosporangiaceae bacterium]
MSKLVFVAPADSPDAVTLGTWGETVRRRAQACGHTVVSVRGPAVTPAAVQEALASNDACLYFGHGTWSTLQQASGLPLLDLATASAASGRSIVAIACQAAHTLGPGIVTAHSATFFLGFDDDLIWVNGLPDVTVFEAAVADGLEPLLDGLTAEDARQGLKDGFERAFQHFKYGVPKSHPNRVLGYVLADWDRSHVALCLGSSPDPRL